VFRESCFIFVDTGFRGYVIIRVDMRIKVVREKIIGHVVVIGMFGAMATK
jgi:hypothetical protein